MSKFPLPRLPYLSPAVSASAPWALWLIGLGVMTVATTESLFRDAPPAVAAIGTFATYVTAATVALLLVGFMFLFALSCSVMLSWLKESVRAASVARAVCLAFWAMTANAWIGAVLVLVDPPPSNRHRCHCCSHRPTQSAEDMLGLPWLNELRNVCSVIFAVACFALLARSVRPLHALLAVLFASATVAFVTTAIGWVGDTGL